jgi:archaellum component FlaC
VNDIPQWLSFLITLIGAVGGSWVGVKVHMARLEEAQKSLRKEVERLREAFDAQTATRSGYIRRVEENTEKITELTGRVDKVRTDVHQLRGEMSPLYLMLQMVCEKVGIKWIEGRK